MGAMNEFLRWVDPTRRPRAQYDEAKQRLRGLGSVTNEQLAGLSLPLRVVHLATVWTVLFKEPSRYNWLLQYYLRAEGLTLSWVGTGRCMNSLDFSASPIIRNCRKACLTRRSKMNSDGWWLSEEQLPGREKIMRSNLFWEMAGSHRAGSPAAENLLFGSHAAQA